MYSQRFLHIFSSKHDMSSIRYMIYNKEDHRPQIHIMLLFFPHVIYSLLEKRFLMLRVFFPSIIIMQKYIVILINEKEWRIIEKKCREKGNSFFLYITVWHITLEASAKKEVCNDIITSTGIEIFCGAFQTVDICLLREEISDEFTDN
jgi:hypothetical protein